MTVRTVAIVGAGIAGLTAALCLARKGIASHILEQADRLEEVGAGLQISPNASGVLAKLGLLPTLESQWLEPERIVLASGRTLRPLTAVPVGTQARRRWSYPYGVLHRTTLQRVLIAAVQAEPLAHLHLGAKVDRYNPTAIATQTGEAVDLIVGADGVWSKLRTAVPAAPPACFSGSVAWRFMVPFDRAPPLFDPRSVVAWIGPSAHLVAYPLAEAQSFNIVAIHQGTAGRQIWSGQSGDDGIRMDAFSGWDAGIRALLQAANDPLTWPLYECADGRWYNNSDLILIGDAAHASTPFAAQGAAMAIEDAAELAAAVSGNVDLPDALSSFEKRRRERLKRVRARADFNRFAYHARGPIAFARDVILAIRSPESVAADFDWLYGYQPKF
ncbi:FAD-dependent monooxygenase [Rhizobium sp. ARZ01]|uniref:FAD-dependent monooxygenase n=1 Tax=Rhizobium sp. ARZ01 TaxID=2769313 RepID=UPI00178153A6|nr:FAD-dependent monooxygenase [Rhizobium sp. ARZ01]MBD9372410.1 FAD-dependent monooxygenase [Rhizobium sp. ARZ01]